MNPLDYSHRPGEPYEGPDRDDAQAPESTVVLATESLAESTLAPTSETTSSPASGRLGMVRPENYGARAELARGGLGRVSEARDQRLGRQVAIKELLRQDVGHQRFLREALITARLQHPSIVPVYEAGYWPDGSPFYAMKLVAGETLAARIAAAPELAQRLALLPNALAMVNAVAYAHEQGVIHRDLKPANVVLGEFGETVVVDWGLAKDLRVGDDWSNDDREGADTRAADDLTRVGTVLGTPAYMPPEQARDADVDESADVYALGATLYHLLAGRPPYLGASGAEVLERLAAGSPTPLAQLAPGVPPDLAAIVERAMAREPAERYPGARALAADLQRFQNGQLVAAYRYSAGLRMRRWLARHRRLVAVAGVLSLALAVTAVVSAVRVVRERDRAHTRFVEAEAARQQEQLRNNQLTLAQAALERDSTAAIAWLASLPADAQNWPQARLVATEARNRGVARHVWRDATGLLTGVTLSADERYLALATQDGSLHLRDLQTGRSRAIDSQQSAIHSVHFSPDGSRLWSAGYRGSVRSWSVRGEPIDVVESRPQDNYTEAVFSADGRYLALAFPGGDILLRTLATGAAIRLAGAGATVLDLAFSPDSGWLVAGDSKGVVRRWSVAAPSEPVDLRGHERWSKDVAFSHDGRRLATASADGRVCLWDLSSGRLLATLEHGAPVAVVRFSSDDRSLATGTGDGAVQSWSLQASEPGLSAEPRQLGAHDDGVISLTFSPEPGVLASGGGDGLIKLWDLETGRLRRTYTGRKDRVSRLIFSRERAVLWSVGRSSGVREWDLSQTTWKQFRGPPRQINTIAIAPDDAHIASGHSHGGVMLWDLASERGTEVARHPDTVVYRMAFSRDGGYLASAGLDGSVRVYRRDSAKERALGAHQKRVNALVAAPDGPLFATASSDMRIGLWHAERGHLGWFSGHEEQIGQLAFSADGAYLASASGDATVRLWRRADGTATVLGRHADGANAVAFAPTGEVVASGGSDGLVHLYRLGSGERQTLSGYRQRISRLAYAPNGRQLAVLGRQGSHIALWELASGTEKRLLVQNPIDMAWSPDGQHLVALAEDATVRAWHVASGQGHIVTRLPLAANTVRYAHGGGFFAFGDRRRKLHLWYDDLPTERRRLRTWIERATSAEIAPGRVLATPGPAQP